MAAIHSGVKPRVQLRVRHVMRNGDGRAKAGELAAYDLPMGHVDVNDTELLELDDIPEDPPGVPVPQFFVLPAKILTITRMDGSLPLLLLLTKREGSSPPGHSMLPLNSRLRWLKQLCRAFARASRPEARSRSTGLPARDGPLPPGAQRPGTRRGRARSSCRRRSWPRGRLGLCGQDPASRTRRKP